MSKKSIVFCKKVEFTCYYDSFVDSSVSIVTGCRLDCQGFRVWVLMRASSLFHVIQIGSGVDTAFFYPVGAGVKQLGHEADHSPPTIVRGQKYMYTSTRILYLMRLI
jgi:hypothetical protein